jgi:hypothetical protein
MHGETVKKGKCFSIAYGVVPFSKPLNMPIQQNLISFYGKISNAYPEMLYDKDDIKKNPPTGICLFIILQHNSKNTGVLISP